MNQYLAMLAGVALLALLAWVHAGSPAPSILAKFVAVNTRNSLFISIPNKKSKCPRYGKPS